MANNNYIDTTVRCPNCRAFEGISAERHEDGTDYRCASCKYTWHSDADNGFRDYHEKRLVLQSKLIQLSHSRVSDGRKHINDKWRVVVEGGTAFYEHNKNHRRIDNEELDVLYKQVKALESEYPDFAQRDPIFGYMWIMLFTKGCQLSSNRIGEYRAQTDKTPYNVPGEVGYLKDYNARCEIAYNRRQTDRQKEQDKKDQRNSPEAKKKRKAKAKAIIAISLVLVIAVTVVSLIYVLAPQVYFGTCTVEYYLDGERFTQDVAIKGNFSIEKPTKLGYRFLGFFADEDGKNQIVGADGNSVVKFDADKKNDSVKLYPIWEPIEYTIVFKPNGGRISGADNMKVEYGQTIGDLPTNVVRTGYIFKGWANESGTLISGEDGKVYSDKKVLHESNHVIPKNEVSEIVFTAVWEAETYTATLDVNGGDALADDTISLTFGEKSTLPVPTKEGHNFVGWYNGDQKYTNETGALLSKWNVANNDTLLVARWEVASYEIEVQTDNAGGSVSGPSSADYNSSVQLTATTNPGYTWLGWYDGDTKVSEDLIYTFTMPAESKTYTAKWACYIVSTGTNIEEAGTYTIKTEEKVTVGDTIELTATTNPGYTWLGWYDGDAKVSEGNSMTYTFTMPAESKTYTAKWSKVTLATTPSSAGSVTSLTGKYNVGDEVTVTATTNDGYTWLGWYDGNTKVSEDLTYTFTMSAENKTYTAKWTYYTVSTETNIEGAGTYTAYLNHKVTAGNTVTLTATTNAGYTFNGWYIDGSLVYSGSVYDIHMPANDIVIEAKWTPNVYTVTLDVNGGDALAENFVNITFNSKATLPVPTKEDHDFVGWYNGDQKYTDETGVLLSKWNVANNDTLLVAHWQKKITISFANCDSIDSEVVFVGSSYTLPTPTHGKYKYDTFAGWEWNGTTYTGSLVAPDSDVTLKACWNSNGWTYIETKEQMNAVRDNLLGKYCLLNDINLGSGWTPIGQFYWNEYGSPSNQFRGHFDGNGFEITYGIEHHSGWSYTSTYSYGLFGTILDATIENLTVDVYMDLTKTEGTGATGCYAGGIAGWAKNSRFENCTVKGSIVQDGSGNEDYGVNRTGGIVGKAYNTYFSGNLNKAYLWTKGFNSYTGGICGGHKNCVNGGGNSNTGELTASDAGYLSGHSGTNQLLLSVDYLGCHMDHVCYKNENNDE